MTYWSVPKAWAGETAFLLASGPSMARVFTSDLGSRIRGAGRVIAINNAYRLMPKADVLYACDHEWWKRNEQDVDQTFRGQWKIMLSWDKADPPEYQPQGVLRLRQGERFGLSTDPTTLRHGCNSGYQAINLAFLLGAIRIILLGYDMRVQGNQTHFHGQHPGEMMPDLFQRMIDQSMLPSFPSLMKPLRAAGVEVWNSTPGSRLQCWPYVPIEEALERAAPERVITDGNR